MTKIKASGTKANTASDKRKSASISASDISAEQQSAKRDRKTQRTRRHIAEVAMRIFEQKGFVPANVSDIAEAADYSTSTFFRLFPDKEEVVFYDFAELLEELKANFAKPGHGNAWATIRTVFVGIAHQWDVDSGELGIRRLRLIYKEPVLHSRFLSKASDWEIEMAKLISSENNSDPECDLLSQVSAGAASAAFLAGLRIKLNDDSLSLAHWVQVAFDQIANVGEFYRTPVSTGKKRSSR